MCCCWQSHAGRELPQQREGRRPWNRPSEERGRLGPRAGIPKRLRFNCHSKSPWHPKWAGPLTTSLRGLWGQWLPAPVQWWNELKGRRPKNRPSEERGRLGPRAGIPKRKRPNCHEGRYSRTSVGSAPRERPQRPQCVEEKGPEDPGVAAPLACAGCRGNCWYAGKIFSVASRWTTPSRLPSTSAYVLHGVWLQEHV